MTFTNLIFVNFGMRLSTRLMGSRALLCCIIFQFSLISYGGENIKTASNTNELLIPQVNSFLKIEAILACYSLFATISPKTVGIAQGVIVLPWVTAETIYYDTSRKDILSWVIVAMLALSTAYNSSFGVQKQA